MCILGDESHLGHHILAGIYIGLEVFGDAAILGKHLLCRGDEGDEDRLGPIESIWMLNSDEKHQLPTWPTSSTPTTSVMKAI